ncbi:hypothetical protein ACFVFS_24610 [Kitasatospora sp. NPDC057692]|uniref:hypothetical protein n=1 Tax=Kitasatospora sp. NPDC057692 TaxID=3346215 RepID=UPI0036C43F7B
MFPAMTVRENIDIGAHPLRRAPREDLDRVHLLFPVPAERLGQEAGTPSGGDQQLLHEPSTGLAPPIVTQIFAVVREINGHGDRPARRAERRPGAQARRPRLRPGDRVDRDERPGGRAAGRSPGARRLSRQGGGATGPA